MLDVGLQKLYTYVNEHIRKYKQRKVKTMNELTVGFFNTSAIETANLGVRTKAQYRKALNKYLATGNRLTDAGALAMYAMTLPNSSRSFLKAAVRIITQGYQHDLKANVVPETLTQTQAALMRLESLNDSIRVTSSKGDKAHTWLSQTQVKQLVSTCDDTEVGRRDWIVLALLLGAGLRREELVTVACSAFLALPAKKGTRTVLQVKGKGAKDRVVPISAKLAERVKAWCEEIGTGLVARSLGRKRELGDSLSGVGVFNIVRKHGAMIGKPNLDPHDLRRTYAQLGYEAGVPLTQISKLLGHSSVATTQRYLNLDLDLEVTASDFIPLE